jgi:hypothetical protein
MALPREHLARLRKGIADHKRQMEMLREVVIPAIKEELLLHEAVVELAQNKEFIAIFEEIHEDPTLARSLAQDPKEYFERKGVRVPGNVTLSVGSVDESGNRVTVNLDVGSSRIVEGIWDRELGFLSRPIRPHPMRPYLVDIPDTVAVRQQSSD